jgi:hypothetical protein
VIVVAIVVVIVVPIMIVIAVVIIVIIVVAVVVMIATLVVALGDDERRGLPIAHDIGASLGSARRPNENRHCQEERSDHGHR